jgi:diguanylate cyclase (GGDEF)-like protein
MDHKLIEQIFGNLQVGIVLLDPQWRVLAWNAWIAQRSGLSSNDTVGQSLDKAFPELASTRLHAAIDQALRFRLSSVLTPGLHGGILPLYQKPADQAADRRLQPLIYVSPMLGDPECACMLQIQDMTATIRRERRLRARSTQLIATTYRDPLTGVGNRRRFDDDLREAFREAQERQRPLAMLMIDVDDFKAYNDHLGHPQGDQCLIQVARALQEGLRQKADRVSRYGGEEFAILLPDTDRARATAVAERLRHRVESQHLSHPASRAGGYVTVSIGVSGLIPKAEQPAYDLISQADLALYMAKEEGRNRVLCYDSEVNEVRFCA